MRRMPDRHLLLLHHLQQRRLHLRRRTIDLIRQQKIAEHRAELGIEIMLVRTKHPSTHQITRHQIRRELNPRKRPTQHRRRRLDRQRLRQARHTLDQQMPTGKQTQQQPLQHPLLTRNHPPDLEQRLLELLQMLLILCRQTRTHIRHIVSLRSSSRQVFRTPIADPTGPEDLRRRSAVISNGNRPRLLRRSSRRRTSGAGARSLNPVGTTRS